MKNLPVHSSKIFSYSNQNFVAESSDLGPRGMSQVWDDACDLGFSIRSERTNVVKTFVIDRTHTDNEGDVTHWTLREINGNRIIPDGLSVTLFNN